MRIKEGEILWGFSSRNVIAAFFIEPQASQTRSLRSTLHLENLRAFYRPVAAGATPADLRFLPFLPRNVYFGAA